MKDKEPRFLSSRVNAGTTSKLDAVLSDMHRNPSVAPKLLEAIKEDDNLAKQAVQQGVSFVIGPKGCEVFINPDLGYTKQN